MLPLLSLLVYVYLLLVGRLAQLIEAAEGWNLYNEVGRGDVPGQGAEVDPNSPLLMGCQLGIVLLIQRDAGKGPSDGRRVTGVHLFEYD